MQGRVWGVLTCILTVVCAGGFVSDGGFGQCAIRLRIGAVRRQGCEFQTCQGRRGLVRPFWVFVLGWMCKTGERTSLTWGAVSPVIGAAVLVDVRSGLANTKMSRDDVGASCMQTSFAGVTGLSGEHDAGLGLSKGDRGLVGRKSLALGMGPIDSSMFVAQSNVMFAGYSAGGGTYADCAVSWQML
jgi:hypothetical protein